MHVLKLLDQHDRACLEVHVPKEKLQESVALFLRLHPGKRLSIDGTIVQLGESPAPPQPTAATNNTAVTDSAGNPSADAMLTPMTAMLRLGSMMFAEHIECQRRLTEEMIEQYRKVRTSLAEIDLMSRGVRVVEFQEIIRGIQAMNGVGQRPQAEEGRSWRNPQFERFLIGGLKATKIVEDP